jgi:hypothetical protein
MFKNDYLKRIGFVTSTALMTTVLAVVPISGANAAPLVSSTTTTNPTNEEMVGTVDGHLMTAAILAAGLDGILNKLEAPEPVVGMSYENESAPVLPMSLEEALDALQKDTVLREILQGPIVDIFDVLKRDEVRRYKEAVSDPNTRETTDWEVKEYMSDF